MRYINIALLALLTSLFGGTLSAAPVTTSCNNAPFANVISHDLTFSYCELCGIGQVSILLSNPSNITLDTMTVTENLGASGLTHVAGSTTVSINGGGFAATGDPVITGGSNQTLTWTSAQIPALTSMDAWINDNNPQPTIEIRFQVQRDVAFNEEGLVTASRLISATVDYSLNSCVSTGPYSDTTGNNTLPLREPNPVVGKLGRNVDAAQGVGSYSATVYGNIYDDVIWRIQVQNTGSAALQDLRFDDLMTGTNFQITTACPSETQATAWANNNGADPGGTNCVAASNTINAFVVDDPFGNPGNDEAGIPPAYVDVVNGGSAYIYLVGKIQNPCDATATNTVSNVQWGCEVDAPDGGITTTSTGATPGSATTTLSSLVVNSGLNVTRALTGTNLAQPVGSKGTMTITITNNTGGTVKNIVLTDLLPAQYVVDATFTPTINVTPMYGVYPGMVDTVVWDNPAVPTSPLSNIEPIFSLTSTTSNSVDPVNQVNMLRQGDVAVVRFRVVMIEPTYYDLVADLDVRTENTADATDPTNAVTLNNQLTVQFEQFCNPGVIQQPTGSPYNDTFASNPEDLDVDITGTELVFILTNDPTQPLPLTVSVTNNGGHDAADYVTYVSFGATMDVITWPIGVDNCVDISPPPPPLAVWDQPAAIPLNATIFACTGPTIAPGATRTLNFEVIKTTNPAGLAADDLTFRADTVGQINLSDGTPLTFPTPDTSVIANSANNYTLDGVRARVVGFNLTKAQQGNCTENNPPPATPDNLIQIGEECSVRIRTGGWFGFQTPGFTYIAVQNVQVVDELPAGQGYISSTDPTLTSDPEILGITLNPPPLPLDEGWFDWTFNTVVPAERITVKDKWFQADVTTRMMNNPQNSSAAPNVHAATSTNILNSYFQAVFQNLGVDQVFNLGPSTIGYPQQSVRQVDLTVTEPNITVQKRVCNETLYGFGAGCTNFVATANDGDTFDSYIYRVTLTNGASSGGVARAPAYDISTTDILDASDLVYVIPFATDGLDNDGDGLIDAADLDGESSITDNVVNNGTPAQIDNSWTHSSALLRLDPGASVTFYYRVDPDQRVAPLQTLVNNVTASYDSLEGGANQSGNQTVVLSATGDPGGARIYTSAPGSATVQIRPLNTQPKDVIATSNTALGGVPQPVSIGEEVEYQLRAYLPVANLRSFTIQDNLPPGISCIEAPVIDLDAPPYSAAGFSPGGQFTPTCTANSVTWNFGNQELTVNATPGALFEFPVTFIARVNNIASNNEAGLISNGSPATVATVSYLDNALALQVLNFAQNDLVVREPVIALTKTMEAANADASDILTVTVTATNTGTATAYNLRVFDDLAAVANLTYLGNVGGTDPPDNVDLVTFGANRPLFSWNSANPNFAIAPGATKSFTFEIQVDPPVQPLEVLDNTIQADWTSLPSQNTALNSSGSIGINGAADGMRIGALPNAADPINDYEATASAFATVPPIAVTKTDLNPTMATEIGAHKHFQLVLTFPEGVSNGVVVNDNLASTGLSYLLTRDANFDVSYSFTNITSINGVAPAEGAFNAVPVNGASGTVVWNIGTVVTPGEDDTAGIPAITPTITIDYYARINNDLATNVGGTLQNGVTVNYTNGETSATEAVTANTALITVTEPNLAISKVATLATSPPIVGDSITYTVTVVNTGNATAYDINLIDLLPAEVNFDSTFTPTATINGTPVAGFVTAPLGAPVGPLQWGRSNGDNSLDLPVGGTLVLTYHVQVLTALPGGSFTNQVWADWTSQDNVSAYERTGAGCPTITAPNDYCVGPATSTVNFIGPDTITLQKSGPATLAVATPGTFTLNAQNTGTGTAWDLTITDLLPNGANGGMCSAAPIITSARIFQADAVTPVSAPLVAGVDFVSNFAPAPACTLSITMQTAAAAIGVNQRLIVTYTAQLDATTAYATPLTNIAGATQWFSGDTAGAGALPGQRTYTRTLTDGTPGVLDYEDAWTLNSEAATLIFRETVANVTTATNPAATATPGDLLRYTITLQNGGGLPITDFTLLSDLDALNGAARFAPGTLSLVTVPGGANITNTSATGGTYGSGLLDVRALNLDAAGGANDTLTLEFEVQLGAVFDNGTVVLTQTHLVDNGATIGYSDDPNVNGIDNPAVMGDEDPTRFVITSAPAFEVWKISTDLTGDPAVLDPGDTLRYTITAKNIGTENAINATLRDLIPANTTYVANSTTLNGAAVADPGAGISPLEAGMLINAPEDPTPGAMRADANPAVTSNIATITFDVVVSSNAVNGTVISNQGFVNGDGAGSGAFPEEPSDDPATAIINDPTRDVVGALPLVDATKTVTIAVDGGTAGIVDPGDTLRYTITINNFGATNATGVTFTDAVPANTTYVGSSTSLNGIAIADPALNVSPLIGGINVSSSDLTPPLPGAGAGVLTAGQNAVVVFDVTVDALTPTGTVISNQGTVYSTEQAAEPTDADGNDANGDQPTQIVVGSAQQLAISKSVSVVGGGAALPGADLEYVIVVTNIGSLPAADVLITDNLDLPVAGQLTYVAGSGTLNGSTAGVSFAAPIVTANYGVTYGNLAVGASATLRFRATINGALPIGTTITNIADVSWNAGTQTASATVSIDVGGIPGVASLSGQAWHDANFDLTAGGAELPLAGWNVEVYRNGTLIGTVVTDANGLYSISGLAPNDTTTDQYELRFRAPGHTTTTALLGNADSIFTNGLQNITAIVVGSGSITQNMNMPASPDGVVYDSMQRIPIAGATLTLLDATSQTALPSSCFVDTAQQGQVTLASGYYRFDINFSNGACVAGGTYLINVTPPASGYTANTSMIIPPQTDGTTAAFDVPACLGSGNDAVPGTPNHCEVVDFETAPPISVASGTAGTNYHLHLLLNNTQVPGESQLFNNHIPLDPDLSDSVAITKTAARVTVSRGEFVPYTITINNNYVLALNNQSIVDNFPPGFKYVSGSARYDGAPLEPTSSGTQLRWDNIDLASDTRHVLKLLFIVGSGVSEGDYVNRAQIINNLTGGVSSGEATATVRVVPDPTFDCSDVIGKVFDDKNLNGYQDEGEPGLPNARVVSARGLIATSDEHGRFHITCAAIPDESRGSNYILKVDERTLPSGYRLTTENPRVQRLTRGKMMKFNFGAAIHHVVRIDVADGVFKPDSDEMREQWKPRIDLLISELKKAPSLLRITYLADTEKAGLVDDRLAAIKAMIEEKWDGYPLTIESEIHWRRGGPVGSPGLLD